MNPFTFFQQNKWNFTSSYITHLSFSFLNPSFFLIFFFHFFLFSPSTYSLQPTILTILFSLFTNSEHLQNTFAPVIISSPPSTPFPHKSNSQHLNYPHTCNQTHLSHLPFTIVLNFTMIITIQPPSLGDHHPKEERLFP